MSEQQLRKALGAVNDLEPPRDDLFVERAMSRGRARAHRRRSWVVGAAAGVALVAVVGGTWVIGRPGQGTSASSAGAPEAVTAQNDTGSAGGPAPSAPVTATPGMPAARDLSGWFSGPRTPVRGAMEALAPTLEARFADVFAGMYGADASNARVVVCVTRSDPALEDLVRSAAGADVEYRTVAHSIRELQNAASRVESQRVALQARGVTVLGTRFDARANRVVVTTTADDHGLVSALTGSDLVTVVVDSSHTPRPMLPGGSTLPPLQR